MAGRNELDWTEDEHILALDLCFRSPPSTIGKKHASVVELSDLLNRLPIHPQALRGEKFRNPDGVYMKLCNFLRLDPSYAGKGPSRPNGCASMLPKSIWLRETSPT
jgi:5-methylcytosine-specific restriction protein A